MAEWGGTLVAQSPGLAFDVRGEMASWRPWERVGSVSQPTPLSLHAMGGLALRTGIPCKLETQSSRVEGRRTDEGEERLGPWACVGLQRLQLPTAASGPGQPWTFWADSWVCKWPLGPSHLTSLGPDSPSVNCQTD